MKNRPHKFGLKGKIQVKTVFIYLSGSKMGDSFFDFLDFNFEVRFLKRTHSGSSILSSHILPQPFKPGKILPPAFETPVFSFKTCTKRFPLFSFLNSSFPACQLKFVTESLNPGPLSVNMKMAYPPTIQAFPTSFPTFSLDDGTISHLPNQAFYPSFTIS